MQTTGEQIILYKQNLVLAKKALLLTELIPDLLQKDKFKLVAKKIKKRGEIIRRMNFFGKSIKRHQRCRKSPLSALAIQEEELLQNVIKEIKKIFVKIRELDQEICAQIVQQREKVSMALKKVSVDNRYFPKKENVPRFLRVSL